MKINVSTMLCAGILSVFSFSSSATLIPRLGGQAVYDSDLDVTWLTDANIYPNVLRPQIVQQLLDHNVHPSQISDMYPDTPYIPGYGFSNDSRFDILGHQWRIPTALIPDRSCTNSDGSSYPALSEFHLDTPLDRAYSGGYNCTGGELGHLFYNEFDATISVDSQGTVQTTIGNPDNLALFDNLVTSTTTQNLFDAEYWTSTTSPFCGNCRFVFNFSTGELSEIIDGEISGQARVLLIRDGDISAVPIPAAAWLFGSGLLGLLGLARNAQK